MRFLWSVCLLVCGLLGQLHLVGALRDSGVPSLSETSSSFFIGRAAVQEKKLKEEEELQQCLCAEKECEKAGDMVLKCPAGKRVGIMSAFWNRRKRDGCIPKEPDNKKAGIHCNPNATEEVLTLCRGQEGASCTIRKGFTGCEENPFTWMRVRWHCHGQEEVATEELAMEDDDDDSKLPTMPTVGPTPAPEPWGGGPTKPKPVDKTDEEVQDWTETPDRRLKVTNLNRAHCNGLEVGSWPELGQTGCELTGGVSTHSASPHFNDDAVCRCHYWAPKRLPHLYADCDKIFPKADTIYKVSDRSSRGSNEEGTIAIFGKEGCYCHPDPSKPAWILCDLAVKEV